jgi:HD-like signal output (HDOD) protein
MTVSNVPQLKQLISGAQLPALPQSAITLLELSKDPENGPPEFAQPIEADPGLAGQVLRFVNSSYFGFSREISSVQLAINLVGVRTIKNFALWSAVFSLMPNPKCGPFDLKLLWQDSLRRALFARMFGKATKAENADDLFTAALLQDMAVPMLAKELNAEYTELLTTRGSGKRLSELEFERFGWTHAEAAALMADSWKLPEHFGRLLAKHASLDQLLADNTAELGAKIVAVSSLLPAQTDGDWAEYEEFVTAYQTLGGGDAAELTELFGQIDIGYEEFGAMLKLAKPAKPLASFVQ